MKHSTDVFAEIYTECGGLLSADNKGHKCIKLTIEGNYIPDIGDQIKIIRIKERR